jgi:hypothetical protein
LQRRVYRLLKERQVAIEAEQFAGGRMNHGELSGSGDAIVKGRSGA